MPLITELERYDVIWDGRYVSGAREQAKYAEVIVIQ
jgi:hypothetical protein